MDRRTQARRFRPWLSPAATVVTVALCLAGCDDGERGVTPARARAGAPTVQDLLASSLPLNIAHAGGDHAHPHSTLFAYAESVLEGADVLELDVQLSADGVLVVIHDETLDRTTAAKGPVVERTVAELQALDAAHWWSPCWPCRDQPVTEYAYRGIRTGERPPPEGYRPDDFAIPTLRQVATRFPEIPLDVEIKGGAYVDPTAVARALALELEALDREQSTVVVSFDSAVVQEFHALAPAVAVSPGREELEAWLLAGQPLAGHYSLIQVPPASEGVPLLSTEVVQRAHADGLDVWVWAQNAEEERGTVYRQWLGLGVDGVIAGRPGELEAVISSEPGAPGAREP